LCSGLCDSRLNFIRVSKGIAKPCAKVTETMSECNVTIGDRNVHVEIGGIVFGAKGRRKVNNFTGFLSNATYHSIYCLLWHGTHMK
jgi:hypothetical protein